jgi:putative phosphoesterase
MPVTIARMRIGLVADTHIPEAGPDLPAAAYQALSGCDRIFHLGDLHELAIVDRLDELAPTIACRGNGDPIRPANGRPGVPDDPRIADSHVVTVGGLRIGLTHDLEHLEDRPDEVTSARLREKFDGPVDIAVSGHTHVPFVRGLADGTAFVNPGSPTMPYGYRDIVGTVGFIDIDDGFQISVLDLATSQVQLHLSGGMPQPARRGPRPSGGR